MIRARLHHVLHEVQQVAGWTHAFTGSRTAHWTTEALRYLADRTRPATKRVALRCIRGGRS